ncbi:hypothetical protein GGR27_000301 [Lewinella antarctica]|uniref:Uncharacterized protein n=1 Tax=Neolewinella antarctica TaxID=442734 RepID=A0ABX0X6I2_9BACT|nr:hypothetical protein [Neolewinella antarctica]
MPKINLDYTVKAHWLFVVLGAVIIGTSGYHLGTSQRAGK